MHVERNENSGVDEVGSVHVERDSISSIFPMHAEKNSSGVAC